MRDLLSGALPAPEDEPQQRDVVDAAMEWGGRRRRRDFALTGAAALAVVAIGAGAATVAGGSGSAVSTEGGPRPSSTLGRVIVGSLPAGSLPHQTPGTCVPPPGVTGNQADYCRLLTAWQDSMTDFAKGSAKYIQADLPAGFTVKTTETAVLILTGPDGTTNYLYPSTESASTLDGHMLGCQQPMPPSCVQTSAEGGNAVVNGGPTDPPSAGYVKAGVKDPRVDLIVGTAPGAQDGLPAPTAHTSLLTNPELLKIISDSKLLAFAEQQLQHEADIQHQLQALLPPSQTGSSYSQPSGPLSGGSTDSSSPSGDVSTGATDPSSPPATHSSP